MASRQKLINIHSSVLNKQPKPEVLSAGELAVNNNAENEFISTLNSEGEVVRFSNDLTQVERMEDKEVFPYEGKIDNVDLDNNRSNIEIKLNQKAAKKMRHYDKVNDALDIDGQPINPSSDGGVTDGAGFSIDTSLFAMNGGNPHFHSIDVSCFTNLRGTTVISKYIPGRDLVEACPNKLIIDTDSVSGSVTNTVYSGDTITIVVPDERISACTNLDVKSDNVNLEQCGNNGKITVKEKETVVSGTSLDITESATTVQSCGSIDLKSDNITLEECTDGEGNITFKAKDLCLSGSNSVNVYGKNDTNLGISCDGSSVSTNTTLKGNAILESGKTIEIDAANEVEIAAPFFKVDSEYTNINSCVDLEVKSNHIFVHECANNGEITVRENSAVLEGNTFNVYEDTSVSVQTPTTNVSGTNLNITETNTDITSCGHFNVDSDDVNIEQCTANGKVTVKEKATEISGSSLDITEEDTTLQSCGSITLKSDDISVEECTEGQGSISFKFKDLCLEGSNSATLYGKNNTNVGVSCDGSAASTTTTIKGNSIVESGNTISETAATSITEKAPTINVNASTALNMSAPTTTLSGTNFNVTEANMNVTATTKVDVKSPTVSVSGTNLTVSETNTDVTSCGRFKVDSNAITLEECAAGQGTLTVKENTVDVSAKTITETASTSITEKAPTINVSGTTNNNNFTTVNNTATTINNNTTNYNITGTTKINGNTTIQSGLTVSGNTVIGGNTYMSGRTYFNNTCDVVEANELSDAICEVFNRSIVTMEKTTPAATSEILATYKLFQDGKQIGEDINIPKDHLLKDVSIVYGTVNGTAFTECTSASNNCHWYIKLIWNVFDPQSGHSDDKTTYLLADDFVKDIDDDNSKADRGVNVDVWYDGQMNRVSADTTVVIKNADGSGTKTFGKSNGTHTLSAYTLNMTSGDVRSNGALTNWTYDPFDKKVTVTTPTDVAHVNRNTLSVSYGDVKNAPNSTYDPGNGTANTVRNSSITIPNATKHLNKEAITFQSGSFSNKTYNTESAVTVNVPTDASHIANRSVCWSYGDVKDATGSCYVPSQANDGSFVIPNNVSHITRGSLIINHNGLSDTFDPASSKTMTLPHSALTWSNGAANTGSYDTSAAKEIKIPSLLTHLDGGVITNNDGCISIDKDVCVNGNVTATHFYESSDERLKENIEKVDYGDLNKVKDVEIKSFNFKGEEGKTVGVIAQDVEKQGLDFCVVEGEDGYKKVDYTSFMLLKIAYLEKELRMAHVAIKKLTEELKNKQ